MDLLLKSETIAFFLLAVVYVIGRIFIEWQERKMRHASDEEYLSSMAADRNCSEYDLFRLAAEKWHVADRQVKGDFNRYLTHGGLPHYLRDFVRKNRAAAVSERDNYLNPGGKLPPSWSA